MKWNLKPLIPSTLESKKETKECNKFWVKNWLKLKMRQCLTLKVYYQNHKSVKEKLLKNYW